MLQTGLLWFDDDTKRPLAEKVADAVARYHERVGGAPTVCQLHPASAALLLEQRQKARQQQARARTVSTRRAVQPRTTRMPQLIPDPSLPVNYFFVGREEPDAAVQPVAISPVEGEAAGEPTAAARVAGAPRRRKALQRTAAPASDAPEARQPRSGLKRPASSALAASTSAEEAVDAAKHTITKQQKVNPELPHDATRAVAAKAQPTERSPRTRTRAATLTHSVRSADQNRATPAHATPPAVPPAIAPPRPRKTARATPPAMQPPLPLLVDHDVPMTTHRRRRAS